MITIVELSKATQEQLSKANFFFAVDADSNTVWVSEYKAQLSSVTDKIKSLGSINCHFGLYTEHSEMIAFMKEKMDENELKDFIFEVSFSIEDMEEQLTHEDGYIYVYAKNKDDAETQVKEYLSQNIQKSNDDSVSINSIDSMS